MIEILLSPLGPYILIFSIVVLIILSRVVRHVKIGKIEITTKHGVKIPKCFADDIEVRYFNRLTEILVYGQHGFLSEVRYRVRKNGWDSRSDWDQYRNDAVECVHNLIIQVLDLYYPPDALVSRIDLYEHNKALHDKITNRMKRMYDTMYDIFIVNHKKAYELRQSLQDHSYCKGKSGDYCPNIDRVMEILEDIHNLEGVSTKEICMNEAERAINEVSRWLFSHYLTIYKQKRGK